MPVFDDPKVEAAYQRELIHIEKIRSLNKWDSNGILEAPFVCYGCANPRTDLFMMTGDGLPLCLKCFEEMAGPLNGFDPSS